MNQKFHLKNLDSLRTIAFFFIFLHHAFYTQNSEIENTDIFRFIINLSESFRFGVPVFFVLSGFLITYLMLKEYGKSEFFSIRSFYMRRILRIFPLYYLILVIGFIAFPLFRTVFLNEGYHETANGWMYLFFLSNFDQINTGELPYGVGLGPTWSIAVEEQFYLIWPILFLLFSHKRFVIVILIALLLSATLSLGFNLSFFHTIFCMFFLASGALFAYLAYFKRSFIDRITDVPFWIPLFCIFFIFFFIFMWIHSQNFNFLYIIPISFLIGYIIIQQCFGKSFNFKAIPFLESLGKYTYGFYLYHVIFNFAAHLLIDDIIQIKETVWTVFLIKPLISLSLTLLFGYLSYHYFERHFLNLKRRFSYPE